MNNAPPSPPRPDLDDVPTRTGRIHAAAWKKLFDDHVQARAARAWTAFQPFDIQTDYQRYVGGKLRADGVKIFWRPRGIRLPPGTPTDRLPRRSTGWPQKRTGTFSSISPGTRGGLPDAVQFLRTARHTDFAPASSPPVNIRPRWFKRRA